MVWPSLWFVTGQNAVCYDQVAFWPVAIINLVEYNMNTAVKLYVTITYRNMAFW
jgi:hypothetical protein